MNDKRDKGDRYFSLFPKTLSSCIEPTVRPILKTQGLAGSRIINEWPSVVGQKLSAHSIPQKLSFPIGKKIGGTLSIAVENGFAPQLQHDIPQILERLATYFGYRAVSHITIAHTYVPKTDKPKAARKATLSPENVMLTENIEDDDLREALTAIAKTLSGAP